MNSNGSHFSINSFFNFSFRFTQLLLLPSNQKTTIRKNQMQIRSALGSTCEFQPNCSKTPIISKYWKHTTSSHCRSKNQTSPILVKTFIYLCGLLLTGLAASQGSILRRGNHLGFNALPVTVSKFLILSLNLCFVNEIQWDKRKYWRTGASWHMWPCLLGRFFCHLPWQGWGHRSGRVGVNSHPVHWAVAEAQRLRVCMHSPFTYPHARRS